MFSRAFWNLKVHQPAAYCAGTAIKHLANRFSRHVLYVMQVIESIAGNSAHLPGARPHFIPAGQQVSLECPLRRETWQASDLG
jgi:hypothetical protein